MDQNDVRTSEEDSQGAINEICCLLEDGIRCYRQAGNVSDNNEICNSDRQIKLQLVAIVCTEILTYIY